MRIAITRPAFENGKNLREYKMEYSQLGNCGLRVSRLCLGTMSFGGTGGPTHPWAISEEDAQPIYKMAVEKGITFFDTANVYNHGICEEVLGRALKKYARRDEVVLATKVGLPMRPGPNGRGLSRKHIIESVDASLKRLQVDHIDLLYTHRLDVNTSDDELLEALDHVVKAGKVIYPAGSSMGSWQFAKMREKQKARGYVPFVAMQNLYNLAYREEEREMVPYLQSEGVAMLPWSPIARGFLAGNKPKDGEATNRAKIDLSKGLFGSKQDYVVLERVQSCLILQSITRNGNLLPWIRPPRCLNFVAAKQRNKELHHGVHSIQAM